MSRQFQELLDDICEEGLENIIDDNGRECIDEPVIDAKTEKIDLGLFQKKRGTVQIATKLHHHLVTCVRCWNH